MSRSAIPSIASTQPPAEGSPRARILEVARAHFFRLGFARCTMSDLATELGMSKKTLYQHFRSKEQIIDALIDAKARDLTEGFAAILELPELTFVDRAFRVVRHGVATIGEFSSAFLHDLSRSAPASFRRLDGYRRQVAPQVWEQLLVEGVASGAVRPDINPAMVAQIILIAIEALTAPANLDRLQSEPTETIRRFFDLLFAGLLTPAGRSEYENNSLFES